MNVAEVLKLNTLQSARVVAGMVGLEREVRWVHVVDIPDPAFWVRPGQLLLTTGYAWPRKESAQRSLMRQLADQGLAGVGLAVPQFFEHFPEAACEEADRSGLPLLEIPWEVPFGSITEEVHRAILAEHYRIIEQSETIHRTLTKAAVEAGSLQDLATVLGGLIQRAVTVEDTEGRVLATHSVEGMEDPIHLASLERGETPPEFLVHLNTLGYLESLRQSVMPIRIPPLPEVGAAARVVCPIRLKGELVGFVWIIEGSRLLSELDLRAAEHAALISALHIAHQRELAALEARLGHTFLDALLIGQFESTPQALERAALLGFNPEGIYRVGLMVLDEPVPLSQKGFFRREQLAQRLRYALQSGGVSPLISLSLNQIFFLLPESVHVEALWERFVHDGVRIALGRAYQGIAGVRKSYLEATALVPYLGYRGVYRYEDLLLPRVIAGDREAQDALLAKLFGRLQRTRGGDVVIDTLLTLAQLGFSQKRTAAALNIHLNTLRYRLRRAIDIGGLDLEDAEVRFHLQLARHILSLRDKDMR